MQELIEEGLIISASMLHHHRIAAIGQALDAAERGLLRK